MSGHSKWSTIKRQKGLTDTRRSAVFGKLARQIAGAARDGRDPESNFRLRLAIDRARAANLPNQNIERAIQAGAGDLKGAQVKDVTYEGFGPGQVAILVQALTDNPNRTTAEIRNLFAKHGGSLGSINSVAWMFRLRGLIRLALAAVGGRREMIELGLIDAGADDVRVEGQDLVVETDPTKLAAVRDWLGGQGLAVTSANLEYIPTTTAQIDEPDRAQRFELLGALDQHDDVAAIFSNET